MIIEKENNVDRFVQAVLAGHVVFFISQSAAGKGTVISKIIDMINKHVPGGHYLLSTTSELMQAALDAMLDEDLKRKYSERKNSGYLLPPAFANQVLFDHFNAEYKDGLIIIDGAPRSIEAAEGMINFYHHQLGKHIVVFYLEVTDEEAEKRMIQRNEDAIARDEEPRIDMATAESRRTKLDYFKKDVYPCIPYLQQFEFVTVHIIDASNTKDIVFQQVVEKLVKYHYV